MAASSEPASPALEKLCLPCFKGLQRSCVLFAPGEHDLRVQGKNQTIGALGGRALHQSGLQLENLIVEAVPETRRELPYKKGTFSTLSRVLDRRGRPHALCTRTLLENSQARWEKLGIRYRVGVEIEFFLLHLDGTPVHSHGSKDRCVSSPRHTAAAFLEEVALALHKLHIPVLKYETEAVGLELSLRPLPPLDAADAVLRIKEVVKDIAELQGLQATFAPVLTLEGKLETNGVHYHVSLINDELNPPLPDEAEHVVSQCLLPQERSYAAGILAHLPALMGVAMPHDTSFGRARHAGRYLQWGTEMHLSGARLCYELVKDERNDTEIWRPLYNWEFRAADATADPHLSLAAILGVGAKAIEQKLSLTMRDVSDPSGKSISGDLVYGTAEKAAALGAGAKLPETLEEAFAALAADDELKVMLGEKLVKTHSVVRKVEQANFQAMTDKEKHDWLIRMY